MIKVCIAGCTGWVGKELVKVVLNNKKEFELTGAVSRKSAGDKIGDVIIHSTIEEALKIKTDVLIDYTHPNIVKKHILFAIKQKVNVVVGTSGLTDKDYKEIDTIAKKYNVGVIPSGNFSITASLQQYFSIIASQYISNFEIVDYAWPTKPDAPSGTANELASKLRKIKKPTVGYPIEKIIGDKKARGSSTHDIQIHSVRLPGYKFNIESLFGLEGERLIIKAEAMETAMPYIAGTLLAAQKIIKHKGIKNWSII